MRMNRMYVRPYSYNVPGRASPFPHARFIAAGTEARKALADGDSLFRRG